MARLGYIANSLPLVFARSTSPRPVLARFIAASAGQRPANWETMGFHRTDSVSSKAILTAFRRCNVLSGRALRDSACRGLDPLKSWRLTRSWFPRAGHSRMMGRRR